MSRALFNPVSQSGRRGPTARRFLYERRGLVTPDRTAAGWRAYGPPEMARAAEIVALRALGLSLSQVAGVLAGGSDGLEPVMATHQAALESRMRDLSGALEQVRHLRAQLAAGNAPSLGQLTGLQAPPPALGVAFDLPWPWGGERFELPDLRPLNYIIGPLGSGKTRLAERLAQTLPGGVFLGLDRLELAGAAAQALLRADPALKARIDQALAWLVEDGATASYALIALLVGLDDAIVVVDMVEQGLDQATQEALIEHLRHRGPAARPLFLMTRSCAILDLSAVGSDEAIILCPANHSPPTRVAPFPGAPGYEAVATCLATPEVRARTAGVVAWRPEVA